MSTLSDVLLTFGTTRNAFNYWERSGVLQTRYASTTPGVARKLSRDNALEIGFMAALTRSGLSPQDAATRASEWRRDLKQGSFVPFFVLNPTDGAGFPFANENVKIGRLAQEFLNPSDVPDNPEWIGAAAHGLTQLAIINRAEIVRCCNILYGLPDAHEMDA